MKKCIALGMSLVMMSMILFGCSGSSDDAGDGGNKTDAVDPDRQEGSEAGEEGNQANESGNVYKMVVEIITYGFDDPDLPMIQDAVNEITIPEIGVEVQFATVPILDMATKLGLLVSGGEQIDLVCTGLLTTPSALAVDGLIQPITEYIEASDALMELAGDEIKACKIGDEIYSYPGATASGSRNVFFYDKDLAAQYNIELPEALTTAEDWENLFQQVKASGMEQYGISLGDGINAEAAWARYDALGESTYISAGAVMDAFNGTTIENYFSTEYYMEKSKMVRDWYEKGYSVPDSVSNGYSTFDALTQGAVLGVISKAGVGLTEAYYSKLTGKNVGSIPISDVMITTGDVINFSWGVSSTCERPEKAVEFLELLYTNTELANIMNYGIEGVHYIKNEGSMIISYPEGMDASNCPYGSHVGTYGDSLSIYQREPLTDEDIENFVQYKIPAAKPSKLMGYVFDSSEVQTEITAITAVVNQYAPALACGTVDPEITIPEFLEALDAAGIQKVIAANQSQLDAWLAEQ